jgi:hypothetical protein
MDVPSLLPRSWAPITAPGARTQAVGGTSRDPRTKKTRTGSGASPGCSFSHFGNDDTVRGRPPHKKVTVRGTTRTPCSVGHDVGSTPAVPSRFPRWNVRRWAALPTTESSSFFRYDTSSQAGPPGRWWNATCSRRSMHPMMPFFHHINSCGWYDHCSRGQG